MIAETLRKYNQNPIWMKAANNLEKVAEHGSDIEVLKASNIVTAGLGLISDRINTSTPDPVYQPDTNGGSRRKRSLKGS